MFYRWPNVPVGTLAEDREKLAKEIAEGLVESEIDSVERRVVTLKFPNIDEPLEADVTQSGITFYLGGFDWVTYPTPPHILQEFPQFLPLPQQVFRDQEQEEEASEADESEE